MTQEEIKKKIKQNDDKIIDAVNSNIDLRYDLMLTKAEKFTTETRTIGRGKHKKTYRLKIMHWSEVFEDEGTGKPLNINRTNIIEVDGKKSDHWRVLEYFKKGCNYSINLL